MAENSTNNNEAHPKHRKRYDACPHCDQELSPWQQVLLTIDRALVCKNCWYRIILDISDDADASAPPRKE